MSLPVELLVDRSLVGQPKPDVKKQRISREEYDAFQAERVRQEKEDAFAWQVKQLKTYHSEIPQLVSDLIIEYTEDRIPKCDDWVDQCGTSAYVQLIDDLSEKQPTERQRREAVLVNEQNKLYALMRFQLPPLPDMTDREAVQAHFEDAARLHLRLRKLREEKKEYMV
jgi:hypothetical protein